MVCDRCILIITKCLNELSMSAVSVKLGEVDLGQVELAIPELDALKTKIEPFGFELIRDKRAVLVEKIKNIIIGFVHAQEQIESVNIKQYITTKLHYDYTYLSNTFSELEGLSIKQYLINQKIEKIKELLLYDQLSLTEISFRLGYSSLAHLSNQFKKVTNCTPSEFKNNNDISSRRPLDKLKNP